jgi:hypothetical protein
MHSRFGDIFDHDRDIEVPSADGFIIRSSHKPPILVDEGDRVSIVDYHQDQFLRLSQCKRLENKTTYTGPKCWSYS